MNDIPTGDSSEQLIYLMDLVFPAAAAELYCGNGC